MRSFSPSLESIDLPMVGGNAFGRYDDISIEATYNMIISDNWMVPYAGFSYVAELSPNGVGRGIFTSKRFGRMIAIAGTGLYIIGDSINPVRLHTLDTNYGDVFMDENESKQIAICDKKNIYIYNYDDNTFVTASTPGASPAGLDFTPGYISYQNGRFISVDLENAQWRLSDIDDATSFPQDSQHVGSFQTKGDIPIAAFRVPGKGNLIYVMGSVVTEVWNDVGLQLFPYQRATSVNIDYGCLNSATIAFLDQYVAWLAVNDRSGPVIMYTTGNEINQISTDGINFKLAQLTAPQDCYAFFFKQDGHLIYQITFYTDNITYAYDFSTQKFFSLSDQNLNYHPAKKVAFFNNNYYFVSINDGNLYQFGSQFTYLDYGVNDLNERQIYPMPKIRYTPTVRMPNSLPFVCNNLNFILEQGEDNLYTGMNTNPYIYPSTGAEATSTYPQIIPKPRVLIAVSTNGGSTFSNFVEYELNSSGNRRNRFSAWQLGWGNEFTFQFRFISYGRTVYTNGKLDIHS